MTALLFDRSFEDRKAVREGTHRSRPLADTYAHASSLRERAGITRLADITGLDVLGLPVWVAHRPLSRSLSVSQGKGTTPLCAKVSALMESLESWAAETIETPLLYTTAADLEMDALLAAVPARRPLEENEAIPWLPAWHLGAGAWSWLPYELATLDMVGFYRVPPTFHVGSNGLASGNNLLEAVLHGIYEVVERHNCAMWRHAGEPLQRLDPETIESEAYHEILRATRSAGVRFAAFVVEGPIALPTFCCIVWDPPEQADFTGGGVGYGYGTHADAEVALLRAATEALQSRLTYITGTREDMARSEYEIAQDPARASALQADCEDALEVAFSPRSAAEGLCADLDDALALLQASGFPDVLAVDLGKPELDLAVAKVVIPGTAEEGEDL